MTRTTLATRLTIQRPDGVTRQQDVPVMVEPGRGSTITIGWANQERVVIGLSEAERIALIEALGGVMAPSDATVARFYDRDGSQVSAVKVR